MSEPPGTPTTLAWFREQVADRPAHHHLEVAGRTMHYRTWGPPSRVQIVLIHGGAANGAWWDHIAPGLRRAGQVHAIDLGGHGLSDWTPDYTLDRWALEVAALVDHVASDGPTVLIGHSRGGFLALMASQLSEAEIAGIVMIESAFNVDPPPVPSASPAERRPTGPPPTRGEMIARFQPHPLDVPSLDYAVTHIAEQSVAEIDGRWRWQFDRAFLGRVRALRTEDLRPTNAHVLQVRGSHGLLPPETAESARASLNPASNIVVVEDAGHHVMLQKPRELTDLLASTLSSWLTAPPSPGVTPDIRRRLSPDDRP